MRVRWAMTSVALGAALVAGACGGAATVGVATRTPTSAAAVATPAPPDETATPTPDSSADPGAEDGTATPTVIPTPTVEATPTLEPAPALWPETVVVDYVETAFGFTNNRTLTLARDGSYRMASSDGELAVFDASLGILDMQWDDVEGGVAGFTDVGLGLGGPDPDGRYWQLGEAATLAALSRAGSAFAGEGEYLGRPTILFESDVVPNQIGGGPDFVAVAVDAETGVLLRYEATEAGAPYALIEAVRLEVHDTRLDEAFAPLPTRGPDGQNYGFRHTTLDDAIAQAGYEPLLPTMLPEGYALDGVAVAPGPVVFANGPEGSNDSNENVIHVRYRKGWRTFTVTTRDAQAATLGWEDPFGGEGQLHRSAAYTLSAGSLAGLTVEVSVDPDSIPHLWVEGEEQLVTISGPLTEQQMIGLAESLAPGGVIN